MRSRSHFLRCALTLMLVFAVMWPAGSDAQEEYPEWRDAFTLYINDPEAGGGLVLELGRRGADGLPPAALTVLGDAHLRRGNFGRARKMFLRALDDPSAQTLTGPAKGSIAAHAQMGLGLAAVGAGKFSEAREWFALASAAPGDLGHIATLGQAQASSALGRYDEALQIFEALSEADGLEASVLERARFSMAQILLEAGDAAAASESFASLQEHASGPLARDSAYARALADYRGGQRDGAIARLTALVEACAGDRGAEDRGAVAEPRSISKAERDLNPRTLLQRWLRNYREQSLSAYAAGTATLFALGGCDLAVDTIAVWEAEPVAVEVAVDLPTRGQAAQTTPEAAHVASVAPELRAGPSSSVDRSAPDPGAPRGAEADSLWLVWLAVGLVALVVFVAALRRRQ